MNIATLTRRINLETLLERGDCRCRVVVVGSFINVRIEDPKEQISVAAAKRIEWEAARILSDAGLIKFERSNGIGYVEGGVVMSWSLLN